MKKADNSFYVKTYNLADSLERIDYFAFINENELDSDDNYSDIAKWPDTIPRVKRFFENDDYLIIGTSTGEFGGSIIFADKKTDMNYFYSCSHPVMVDYKDGYYYVTVQLGDPRWPTSQILKIEKPTSLIKLHDTELPRLERQRDSIWHANSHLIEKIKKEIVLIDTANVAASVFYPYKGRNYLIYSAMSDYDLKFKEIHTTFLGEIKHGKLMALDKILEEPTWTSEFEPSRIKNGIYSYKYDVESWNGNGVKQIDFSGRIFVKGDTIVVGHNNIDLRKWKLELKSGS